MIVANRGRGETLLQNLYQVLRSDEEEEQCKRHGWSGAILKLKTALLPIVFRSKNVPSSCGLN